MMITDHTHPAVRAPKLASWAAVLAVVTGAMVLAGWAFDIVPLKSVLPGWIDMKANTAVCFILTGIALLLTAHPHSAIRNPQYSMFLARLCLLLSGLIGLLTLGEYVFGWNPGMDQWLFREPSGAVGTSDPGRMAPETALCFVLLAAALWLAGGSHKTRWTVLASGSFGLVVTALALAAMQSYLTPGLGSHGWFGQTIMAMHTGILFSMLGTAVIAISWRQDILPWSLSNSTTAAFACGMALLVLIGFNTNRSQFMLAEVDRKIAYSEKAQDDIRDILLEAISAHAYVRGYVITGAEHFKVHYLEAQSISDEKLEALRALIAGNPDRQQELAMIEAQLKAAFQWYQQTIDARRAATIDKAGNMIRRGEDLLDNLRSTFDQIESDHRHLVSQLQGESAIVSRLSYLIIAIGTFASLVIFLTVIFKLNFAVSERKRTEESLKNMAAKFHALFEQSADAIMILDEKGFIDSNPVALRLFGCPTRADFISKHPAEFSPPTQHGGEDSLSLANEHIATAIKNGSDLFEWTHLRFDGTDFPAEVLLTALELDGKQVLQATVRDITTRKQAEVALRESEEKFSRIFESSPAMVAIGALDGKMVDVNLSYANFLGFRREEMLGKSLADLGILSGAELQRLLGLGLRSGESLSDVEVTLRARGGQLLNALLSAEIVMLGGVRYRLATLQDITARKQAETRLAEQLEELRRWHDVTSGREGRILDLKHEVNELLGHIGQPLRYPSAESREQIEE